MDCLVSELELIGILTFDPRSRGIKLLKGGKWLHIETRLQQEPLTTFLETSLTLQFLLMKYKSHELFHFSIPYVLKFNEAWTLARLRQEHLTPIRHTEVVQFNSFSVSFCWLSNFFKTIIIDIEKMRVFLHVECGYVLFKIETFPCMSEFDEVEKLKLIDKVIQESDPKTAKSLGNDFKREADDRGLELASIMEMRRLVRLKFEQNPVLLNWLITSRNIELEEHTNDSFWGTAMGTIYKPTSNRLGKILMKYRSIQQEQALP